MIGQIGPRGKFLRVGGWRIPVKATTAPSTTTMSPPRMYVASVLTGKRAAASAESWILARIPRYSSVGDAS